MLYHFRNFLIIISLLTLNSCSKEPEYRASWVKLYTYDSLNDKSFSFEVSNDFIKNNKSKTDPKYPLVTKAEAKYLKSLLKKNNYCINKKGELSFQITSKQAEIQDVTLADVFKKTYNARSVAPATYFGKCL